MSTERDRKTSLWNQYDRKPIFAVQNADSNKARNAESDIFYALQNRNDLPEALSNK